jgi:hypothetical protein
MMDSSGHSQSQLCREAGQLQALDTLQTRKQSPIPTRQVAGRVPEPA